MKTKDFISEGFVEDVQSAQIDHEVQMAREELYFAAENAIALHKLLRHVSEAQGLEAWVSSKITLANDYLKTVREYLEYELMTLASSDPSVTDNTQLPIAESQGVTEGLTSPEIKQAYADIMKTKPGTPERRAAVRAYQKLRADAIKKLQGVAEGHADQQRKIVKKNGKPVGEVGIDRESSPGSGQWYMKCYATGHDLVGYDSMEEALAELKHCLKQGVAEGNKTSRADAVAEKLWKRFTNPRNESAIYAENLLPLIYAIAGQDLRLFSSEVPAFRGAKTIMASINHSVPQNRKKFEQGLEMLKASVSKYTSKGMTEASNRPVWVQSESVADQGVAEATGDPQFDKMLKAITNKKAVAKQQKTDAKQQARDAFGGMFGGNNPADKLGIRKKDVKENASAGASGAGSVATVVKGGKGKTNLLGGPEYKGHNPFKKLGKKK